MSRRLYPLPLRRSLVVAHEIVDIVEQRLSLGEVRVTQQIDVEVRHRDGIDPWRHGVRNIVSGSRRVVQFRRQMHRQVAIGRIERGALGVLTVEGGEVEKQISVHIRGSKKDLAELHLAHSLRIGRDSLERAQQTPIAHAVRDHVHFLRAAVRGEVHEELRDGALAGFDAGLIRWVGRHAAARRPTEKRGRSKNFEVAGDLRRANRRVFESHSVAVQEEERVWRLAALACLIHLLVYLGEESVAFLRFHMLDAEPVVAQI